MFDVRIKFFTAQVPYILNLEQPFQVEACELIVRPLANGVGILTLDTAGNVVGLQNIGTCRYPAVTR